MSYSYRSWQRPHLSNSSQFISLDACEDLRFPNTYFISKSTDLSVKENPTIFRVVVFYIWFEKKQCNRQNTSFLERKNVFLWSCPISYFSWKMCVSFAKVKKILRIFVDSNPFSSAKLSEKCIKGYGHSLGYRQSIILLI